MCSVAMEKALYSEWVGLMDLRGLDLRDDVEWSVVGADAEGDGELAAASEVMDSKGRVTGGNEDRSFFCEPSRSEVGSSLEAGVECI